MSTNRATTDDLLSRIDDVTAMTPELVNATFEEMADDMPQIECIEWEGENGEIVRAAEPTEVAPAEVVALAEAEGTADLREAAPVEYPELADAAEGEAAEPEPPTVIERLRSLGVPETDAAALAEDPLRNDPSYGAVMVDLTDERDVELWLSQIRADIKAGRLVFESAVPSDDDEAELRRAIIDDQMNSYAGQQGTANWTAVARRAQQEELFSEAALEYAAKMHSYYSGYLVFPSALREAQLVVLTLWSIHTYCFQAQGVTPYLAITAPTQGSGKTTVEELLSTLANNPSKVEVNPTAAVVRQMADEGRTVFIDEVDMLAKDKVFTAVLNSGYKAGGSVTRLRRGKDGSSTDSTSTFSPKVVAGIAREGSLPFETATLDRCIEIKIIRAKPGELTKRFRVDVMREDTEVLAMRDWMQHWTNKMRKQIREAYFAVPRLSSSRAEQIWETLITIGGLLGGDWYERICAAAILMDGGREANVDPNAALVADIATVVEAYVDMCPDKPQITVDVLVSLREVLVGRKLRDKISTDSMIKRLGAFGIRADVLNLDGKDELVYTLLDDQGTLLPHWVDLFSRYGE